MERTNQLLEAILDRLDRLAAANVQPVGVPAPSPQALSIEQAQAQLGCSRTRVFDLLQDGTLKRARKIGRRTMVLASSVEAARHLPNQALPATPRRARRRASVGEVGEHFGDRIRSLKV